MNAFRAGAAIQFDVFLGFDGIVREASWFPVICEIKNDGPAFVGFVEVTSGNYSQGQSCRIPVELPTGTLKRVPIPVFTSARYQSSWDVRLLDERGRMRAEKANVSPTKRTTATAYGYNPPIPASTLLIGALPRTSTGAPVIRPITRRGTDDAQPAVARFLQAAAIPDNPLLLEAMDAFYLNSEKAPDFSVNQVNALLAWLNNGGHLIVGVEAPSDVNGTPWLRSIVPGDLADIRTVASHSQIQQWLREASTPFNPPSSSRPRTSSGNPFASLPEDPDFEKGEMQVAIATPRGGEVLAATGETPLIISSRAGRGRVTVLLFSPEREPFKSWKNQPSFWAKLAGVPNELYTTENPYPRGGNWSIDSVFGAMIDSKQIRKLPVEWLLLLLILYLVVIGPLDQYWLKRIKRPMLTWITFPCYVVLFSLLIYFIGYKLRAGETEWNELHLVDVLVHRDAAELRGHTYASIYSPVNATYRVESQQNFSTFRGELRSQSFGRSGSGDDQRADVLQVGDNFRADIFVPVWTSQLYVTDWWQSSPLPLDFSVTPDGQNWSVTVNNKRDRPLTRAQIVIAGRISELGEIPAGQSKTFKVNRNQGTTVGEYVRNYARGFQNASQQRQSVFGASTGGRVSDLPNSSIAISFISCGDQFNFVCPNGLDLTDILDQGNAILLAWEPDYSPMTKPINQFPTRRGHKDTLWRMAVPLPAVSTPTP